MAPKNKKTIKNGFYYFMLEVRQTEEAKGRRFSGLKEVADVASPIWSGMSLEEKEPYNRQAILAKGATSEDGHNKFTSLGVSYATIDAEARELEEAENIMNQTIKNTIRSLDRNTTLLTHKFYLCHVNYFYKGENDFYCVAEIALSEFTIGDGLLNTIHYFVDPGKIPLGLRFEAKDWAEKTHGIPYDSDELDAEKDYYKIYTEIRNFLTKDKPTSIPPVYTMPDSLNSNMCLSAVKSALDTLCEAASESPSQFRVYPLPKLFYEIRNKCAEGSKSGAAALVPSVAIVESEIEKDVFSYARDLGCAFHEAKDLSIHCSLSIVTRWIYTLCDHCCKHVGILLKLGKHCPKDTDVNWDYKYSRMNGSVGRNTKRQPPEDNTNKIDFMPTIIDHGALREVREKEYQEDQKFFKKADEMRPPRSLNRDSVVLPNGPRQMGRGGGMRLGRNEVREEENPWPVSGRGRMFSQ